MVSRLNNSENDALVYKFFSSIEKKSDANQRKLAAELGISFGKVHFLLNALIANGLIEVKETVSNKRSAYSYNLTPEGMVDRVAVISR